MVRIEFHRLRFLVIDDNAHMRRMLRALLHGFGTREVHEAEDGAAGLESFTQHLPDIVITDWAMPIFDGLDLTQMIRQPGANSNPYVAIIMLTGHSEKKRVVAARDAGVTEFLAKPISAKGLYQRIVNAVANPRPLEWRPTAITRSLARKTSCARRSAPNPLRPATIRSRVPRRRFPTCRGNSHHGWNRNAKGWPRLAPRSPQAASPMPTRMRCFMPRTTSRVKLRRSDFRLRRLPPTACAG